MTESTYNDAAAKISELSNAELDLELERAAVASEKAEMLVCCYLSAVRERGAFMEFGYSSVYDYANARFGFGARKTRYLVSLGRKIDQLPKIREALANGKLGWVKASRIASVAAPDNEVMWLDSALSLTVQQLESRIKDGTDTLASALHLTLTEDVRILWENALEIYRRRAGAEISPAEAFELMVAEVIAEWGVVPSDADDNDVAEEAPEEAASSDDQPGAQHTGSPFEQGELWESERIAEKQFAANADYNEVRTLVLERDDWKCTYPGCGMRRHLEVHHVQYRSQGGCDAPWNLTVVCRFHHELIHTNHASLRGRAPYALEWSPPKLMQAVLDRRRNNPSIWVGELDVREWSLVT